MIPDRSQRLRLPLSHRFTTALPRGRNVSETDKIASEDGSLTDLLTVKEAAALSKYATGTIYNKIHRGELVPAFYRGGNSPLFRKADILALLEDQPRERAPRKRRAHHGA